MTQRRDVRRRLVLRVLASDGLLTAQLRRRCFVTVTAYRVVNARVARLAEYLVHHSWLFAGGADRPKQKARDVVAYLESP